MLLYRSSNVTAIQAELVWFKTIFITSFFFFFSQALNVASIGPVTMVIDILKHFKQWGLSRTVGFCCSPFGWWEVMQVR